MLASEVKGSESRRVILGPARYLFCMRFSSRERAYIGGSQRALVQLIMIKRLSPASSPVYKGVVEARTHAIHEAALKTYVITLDMECSMLLACGSISQNMENQG